MSDSHENYDLPLKEQAEREISIAKSALESGSFNLDQFCIVFPDAHNLEDRGEFERFSNGLGEGSEYESEWFCKNCCMVHYGDLPESDTCEFCGDDQESYD